MVIISDCLTHDNKFVHAAQQIIVQFIKKEYPNIPIIKYITDGAVSHFKSELILSLKYDSWSIFLDRYNTCNLAHHYIDFNLRAT